MYTSTSKFPEFQGKSKKYSKECIKYVFKREPKLTRYFLYAVLWVVAFSIISTLCVIFLPVPMFVKENETIIGTAIVGAGFYVFLLVHINKYIYPAVKKHITEFDETQKNF